MYHCRETNAPLCVSGDTTNLNTLGLSHHCLVAVVVSDELPALEIPLFCVCCFFPGSFLGPARRSRGGLMESRLHCHCRGGPPPPPPTHTSWMVGALGLYADEAYKMSQGETIKILTEKSENAQQYRHLRTQKSCNKEQNSETQKIPNHKITENTMQPACPQQQIPCHVLKVLQGVHVLQVLQGDHVLKVLQGGHVLQVLQRGTCSPNFVLQAGDGGHRTYSDSALLLVSWAKCTTSQQLQSLCTKFDCLCQQKIILVSPIAFSRETKHWIGLVISGCKM